MYIFIVVLDMKLEIITVEIVDQWILVLISTISVALTVDAFLTDIAAYLVPDLNAFSIDVVSLPDSEALH